MRSRLIIFTFFASLQSVIVNGQFPVFRSYSMSDGLTANAIRNIYQDSQGFIWIGTWEGLNKFEGNKFTRYTTSNGLPHSMINDVLETSPGVIMVTMNNGTISYIRNGRLNPAFRKSKYVINQVLNDPKRGLLGACDQYGLVKIDSEKFIPVSENDNFSLYDIIKWRDKFLAVGDPSPIVIYDSSLQLTGRSKAIGAFQNCIYRNREDKVFMGMAKGLMLVDLSNPQDPVLKKAPYPYDHPAIQNNPVTSIYQDQDGNMWFGTYAGLIEVTVGGDTKIYTEKDGLPGNRITSILSDNEKNLWVGTFSGLAKLPYQSLNVVLPSNGQFFKSPLRGVLPITDSTLAVLATDAVYQYDIGKGSFRKLLNVEQGTVAIPVSGTDGFTFILDKKIYRWNKKTSSLESKRNFPSNYYFSTAQYGNMVCAGHAGVILQFPDGEIITVLDSIRINSVAWDKKGRILAGGWNETLYRITVDSTKKKIIEIENFSFVPGLTHVRAIYVDKEEKIWAGTRYAGVILLTEKEKGDFQIERINLSNGLHSDWIQCITESPDGNIWIGSLAGISKVIVYDNHYRVFNFSESIGFFSAVNWLSFTSKDHCWGTSDNGVFGFHDLKLENTAALPVYFTNIRFGSADSNHVYFDPGKKIRLRYHENYIRLEYASPGFLNEKYIDYSYRLRGSHDTSWTTPSKQHTVEFASLSPGQYVFEVKMKGWNGEFGPVSRFAFAINPPFWQTWWFYSGVALLLILVAISIVRYRTKQLLKLQKVRNAIATDLHDDIGASLTNISILSQLSLDSLERKEEIKKFISRIRDEVQTSSQALDDIIWSVNSRNDSLDEILARMRRYIGDLFDTTNTRYHIDITSNAHDAKLNMEQRRDIFLIFKESLNNIHKHAQAGNAWIQVLVSQQTISIKVTDDGKGFNPSLETHRNGLKNIKERVDKWNGQMTIDTFPSGGTRITIRMPVENN